MGTVIDLAAFRATKVITTTAPVATAQAHALAPTPVGVHGYYPEMGESKPDCQIEASRYGKHYFLKVPRHINLNGRGVEYLRTLTSGELVPQAQHKVGWKEYKVTVKAFSTIKAQYSVGVEFLLD